MEELKKAPGTGMEAARQQAGLSLAEAEKKIVQSAAGSMIEIGYYLKQIRDARLYEEKGYKNIWEYAEAEFGFHKSTASRYMTRNDRFSKGGNSPELDERYIGYSKSQLQEMLSLDDEQMGQVTPDMTVGEIRQIRKAEEDPDPQLPGQMEIGDFLDPEDLAENGSDMMQEELPEKIQPGSMVLQVKDLISDGGNEEGQQVGVAMSQPSGYCIHRPEFPCTSSEESKRTPGNGTDCTHHCCWDCLERGKGTCRIECYASAHRPVGQETGECCLPETKNTENAAEKQREEKKENPEEQEATEGQQAGKKTDLELLQLMYERQRKLLDGFLELPELDAENEHFRRQELMVKALESMLGVMGVMEDEPELIQPELPLMKNNDQRKEWLQAYREWGVWYTDENIGATYYKYDFENGARLIVEEYENIFSICGKEKKTISEYFHLIGGPEPVRSNGAEKWTRHERYTKYPNSETELVEFLKEVQRK